MQQQIARIRQAISALAAEREQTRTGTGTILASAADVRHTLTLQRRELHAAHAQVRAAAASAQEAARQARAADGSAHPFEQACAGFEAQLRVIEAAQAQLARLSDTAALSIERAGEVLRATLRALDGSLREQLKLLTRLERLDRVRSIAEFRADESRGR